MDLEDLGLVGNCQFAALIHAGGDVVWCCLPRFDSEPVFGHLLDPEGGRFGISAADGTAGRQSYVHNTNVLETTFDAPGGSVRVIDFAPRYEQHGRMLRPTQLVRVVEPVSGSPQVRVTCEPVLGWSKDRPAVTVGSHHLQFGGYAADLRLTTDLPLSYLDGRAFAVERRHYMVLSWGPPVDGELPSYCEDALRETVRHWQRWVKHCEIPPRYQREVIRSALTLKLHCFEDTGAIVAAVTTSLPEAPGAGRNWDYRYCWIRDSYYVVDAFRLLGQFEEREAFVNYVLNAVMTQGDLNLGPVYDVSGSASIPERIESRWAGFNGDGPVRVGNAAAGQVQHDVLGELVLTLAPIFSDERFRQERTSATLELVLKLAERAIEVAGTPDSGIWEVRCAPTPQTFSNMMCWAAADRAVAIATSVPAKARAFAAAAEAIRQTIQTRAWDEGRGSYVGSYDDGNLDASLLQMAPLRLFPSDDPRLRQTVDAIWRGLTHNGWLMRYRQNDGLGEPS
ncbi:MAG: glycoside hydrolase family 15 protein, partial [Vicinamibacterales bacterium]